jgi:hypothetical protein
MNASGVLFHGVRNVLIGFPIIRRLSDTDGKGHNPIHSSVVHGLQHVLRHEFHDGGNLVNGKLLSCAHVRVRIDDLKLFPFDINHGSLLKIFLSSTETLKIYWFWKT